MTIRNLSRLSFSISSKESLVSRTHLTSGALVALTLLHFGLGCGGGAEDKPETGTVTGTVTLDEKPLAEARVVFAPVDGGQSSEAVTDEQGNYELVYRGEELGAKVGQHKVYISTFEESYLDDLGKPTGGRKELVPLKYNEDTELMEEVKPGENTIPLDLKS